MDQKGGFTYPPEFAHIAKTVREVKAKCQQIDEQIKNLPPDRGPQLTLRPPGAPPIPYVSKAERTKFLEATQGQIKDDVWREIETALKDTHTTDARLIREIAYEDLYPDPDMNLTPVEREEKRKKSRDPDASQQFMRSLRYSDVLRRTTERENPEVDKSETIDPVRDDLDPDNFKEAQTSIEQKSQVSADHIDQSQRLMDTMKIYHQAREQKALTEKESTAPNKTITSMSDRFSQSLSYNRAVEKSERPSTPSRDREPDKERD